jgi:hypothetical protein
MILYPTTILFRYVRTIERTLEDLRAGKKTPKGEGVSLDEYEKIVNLEAWSTIEKRFQTKEDKNEEG